MLLTLLPRHRVDSAAWDACVAGSDHPLLYAFSWYLDAVCPAPDWQWMGMVLPDEATGYRPTGYRAVMPVPLRRKRVGGIMVGWRVHQPFFCQLLGIFSREPLVDPVPFYQFLYDHFRYGSVLNLVNTASKAPFLDSSQTSLTQMLDLSIGYERIRAGYAPDCQRNLRRAGQAGWTVQESTDIDPLITLFQQHHAHRIDGGVSADAYGILRNLVGELLTRGRASLRYSLRAGKIEVGALFAYGDDRIIYLFNAASPLARAHHARTLLIDGLIREAAQSSGNFRWFDFESPEEPSIRAFYQRFNVVEQPFQVIAWNRLTYAERLARTLLRGRHP